MKRQKHASFVRRLSVVLGVAAAVSAGCGSDDDPDADSAPSADSAGESTTSTSAAGAARIAALYPEGLRDVRYCEILLLDETGAGFAAEVWNTFGLNECPQTEWESIDADAIAAERGTLAALKNGPRYWTLDSIDADLAGDAETTTFGSIDMFRAATLELGESMPQQTPYTERSVARDTVFGFAAGSEIYELADPSGQVYVMQAYSQIVAPELSIDDLSSLGDVLVLPDGWTFRHRVLDDDLDLLSTEGIATVVQDELQNTYQRVDG